MIENVGSCAMIALFLFAVVIDGPIGFTLAMIALCVAAVMAIAYLCGAYRHASKT